MLALTSTYAHAGYGHWLELQISNPDTTAPFQFSIRNTTCVNTRGGAEQDANSKRVTKGLAHSVPAGGSVVLGFNHDPGSHCDGAPADFSISFDSNVVYFRAYENGEITLNNAEYRGPAPSVGLSFQKAGLGNSEGGRWDWTPQLPPDKLGKAKGHWVNRCPDICTEFQITNSISSSRSDSTESSTERASMMSVTAELGVEYAGVTASISTSVSDEKRVGSSIAREISSSTGSEVAQTFPKPAGWNHVWQWVVSMKKIRTGEVLTYESTKFTCTMDDVAPAYLPDTEASKVGNCKSSPPSAVAAAEPKPTAASSPGMTRAQLEEEFRTCSEARQHGPATDQTFTNSLYWRYLGRGPDPSNEPHSGRISNGSMSRAQLENEFANCPEARAHGPSTNHDFTVSLYWRYLGHGPDANLAHHTRRLRKM